jgi:LysM repeat protein
MLDQYRQDLHSDNDHLGEGRFQMNRRKVVFTLAGAALALLFFLFIIGAFRSEEEISAEKETNGALSTELIDLQARVEKLEQQVFGLTPKQQQIAVDPINDAALKTLIADVPVIQEPELLYSDMPQETMPAATPQPQAVQDMPVPVPAKAAPKTYVIQKGDTLSKISKKFYGTTNKWKMIYDANRDRINNINNLKVGSQIVIPEDNSK